MLWIIVYAFLGGRDVDHSTTRNSGINLPRHGLALGCRNADYGWADHPAGPSAPSNTCEVIIGMRRCGLTHESRAVRESAGYVIKHLQALGENVTKETRNLS